MNNLEFSDRDWRRLLLDINEGQVIPVIGPELLVLEIEGQKVPLHRHLGSELATRLGLDASRLPAGCELRDVVDEFLRQPQSDPDDLYFMVREIIGGADWEVPEPLEKLAAITSFDLYVSASVDSLMERALNEVRFGGEPLTRTLAYARKSEVVDLPSNYRPGGGEVTLFQFFGRVNPLHDFVVTEEDILEFVHRLQSRDMRPQNLFDQLRNRHLLALGCNFPNWLTRFFLAAAKGEDLFTDGARGVVADEASRRDRDLVLFFERCKTSIFEGEAVAFVDELHRRWTEANGAAAVAAGDASGGGDGPNLPVFVKDSVFISYASEDGDAAAQVAAKLEEAGMDVWFDKDELVSGDDYRAVIESSIEQSSFFVPIISRNSVQQSRRFYWLEWNKAIDDSSFRPPGFPFIKPIVVDGTPPTDGGIPQRFRDVHCAVLERLEEFVENTKRDIRKLRRGTAA